MNQYVSSIYAVGLLDINQCAYLTHSEGLLLDINQYAYLIYALLIGLLDIFRTIETLILSPYPEDNFVELTWLGWSYLDLIGANWDLLGIYECT